MSRLEISFPFIWNSLSGIQPAARLDSDFNAVPGGDVTIRGRVLVASYILTADDEYSFFLCVPTNNMTLSLPDSPGSVYSFFVSNQSTTKTVTLVGTVSINGAAAGLNPVLLKNGIPGQVYGGFVIWDGSGWTIYTDLFGKQPAVNTQIQPPGGGMGATGQ